MRIRPTVQYFDGERAYLTLIAVYCYKCTLLFMPSLHNEVQNRHGRYIKRKHYTRGSVLFTIADIQNGYPGT